MFADFSAIYYPQKHYHSLSVALKILSKAIKTCGVKA